MIELRRRCLSLTAVSALLLAAAAGDARALDPPRRLSDLGREASLIVQGKVIATRYARNADESLIYTWVTLKVHRAVKGEGAPARVRFRVMGGHIGEIGLYVPGSPAFVPGEETMVLLSPDDEGILSVHGWNQGKFSIREGIVQGLGVTPDHLAGVLTGKIADAALPLGVSGAAAASTCSIACDPSSTPALSRPEPAMMQPLLVNPAPMDGCSQDQWLAAVEAAAETWNGATSNFIFTPTVGGTNLTSKGKQPDGNNVIYVGSASSQLAYTTLWFNLRTGALIENDTVISVDKNSIHWSCEAGPQPGRYDVQGAVTHELGHFLFLKDITDGGCRGLTMYGAEYWNDVSTRTLEPPDVCGIETLYP